MKACLPIRARACRGFTLIELMAAIVVLTVLLAICFQITSASTSLIGAGRLHLEALTAARGVFDRLTIDIDSRCRETTSPFVFGKNTGGKNDTLGFCAEARREPGSRAVQFVSYRISADPADPLEGKIARASAPFHWTGAEQLTFAQPAKAPAQVPTATDYQVLAPGLFRLELGFISSVDGTLTANPPAPGDWSHVAAILVSVAVVSPERLALLTPAQQTDLANTFPDASDNIPPLAAWQTALDALAKDPSFPQRVSSAVRVYQRVIHVQ